MDLPQCCTLSIQLSDQVCKPNFERPNLCLGSYEVLLRHLHLALIDRCLTNRVLPFDYDEANRGDE